MRSNGGSTHRPAVLLAEDELLVRMLAEETLTQAGFVVHSTESADEALALLREGLIVDLLVTDIRMPGQMDGIDLARAVLQATPALPVIITSGFTDRQSALNDPLKLITFFPKPYDPSLLMSVAAALVGEHKNAAANGSDDADHL